MSLLNFVLQQKALEILIWKVYFFIHPDPV
jgi:hypothetical protein